MKKTIKTLVSAMLVMALLLSCASVTAAKKPVDYSEVLGISSEDFLAEYGEPVKVVEFDEEVPFGDETYPAAVGAYKWGAVSIIATEDMEFTFALSATDKTAPFTFDGFKVGTAYTKNSKLLKTLTLESESNTEFTYFMEEEGDDGLVYFVSVEHNSKGIVTMITVQLAM